MPETRERTYSRTTTSPSLVATRALMLSSPPSSGTAKPVASRPKRAKNTGRSSRSSPFGQVGLPVMLMAALIDERRGIASNLRESNERAHSLAGKLIRAQERERTLIARELHDEIGQALTIVKINLDTMRLTEDATARSPLLDEGVAIVEQAIEQVRDLSLLLRPAMLDFGDDEDEHDPGALLYLVFEGNDAVVGAEEALAGRICLTHGGEQLSRQEPEQFWLERHEIARRFARHRRQRRERGRDGVYRDWIHVALSASKVLPFRRAALELIGRRRGVRLQESGLWVQPELFSMRLGAEEGYVPNAQLVLEETVEELLRLVQRFGGSMEYTHGVGIKLASLMAEEHGYGLDVMRQIKQALDPNKILNPGKSAL